MTVGEGKGMRVVITITQESKIKNNNNIGDQCAVYRVHRIVLLTVVDLIIKKSSFVNNIEDKLKMKRRDKPVWIDGLER